MRIDHVLIASGFLLLLVSFWNRNDLPETINYVDAILEEPVQKPTRRGKFTAGFGDVEYLIEPEYDYDLVGMIVSFRHHDGNSRMHQQANDHLNMLDVCVIWGDNTRNSRLEKIDFWNGIFTCNVKTRDQAAWDQFDMYQLSNNHLLSDNERIREKVKDIRVGDQIRVAGYLASYSSAQGGKRGTSTTRMDSGDGACETLYVERFEVVEAATGYWRISMWLAVILLLTGLAIHFYRPYRPYN